MSHPSPPSPPAAVLALDVVLLYCTVLYCTVLYCTVLYCTVLYCTVQVTERLGERLQNINLWKFELEKTIRDMVGLKLQRLHRFSQSRKRHCI